MKTKQLTAATVAVAALATVVAPLNNVFAATAPTWTGGSSATINRQIQNAYGTISNTFTYTISADSGNPTGATGAPTSASVVFNDSYTTQGTATKSATLDFSAMQFTQVGDYSYAIAETASSNAAIYPVDSTNTYTAVVSVRNSSDLTGYVASLYIKDKNGDKLTTSTCGNSATVSNGSTIKLKANDTITIGLNGTTSEIPVGTTYTITKADTTDGYTTTIDGTERTTISKTMVATNDANFNTANKTSINEALESAVDTGVFMNLAIYILLAMAGIAGVAYAVVKKNAKDNA